MLILKSASICKFTLLCKFTTVCAASLSVLAHITSVYYLAHVELASSNVTFFLHPISQLTTYDLTLAELTKTDITFASLDDIALANLAVPAFNEGS